MASHYLVAKFGCFGFIQKLFHLWGTPLKLSAHFQVYIQPSADEAERVRLSNVADSPVSPDVPQTMLLNMNGADGDVECKIISPSGREDDCFITPLGEGEHSVRFVPKEEGTHYLVMFIFLAGFFVFREIAGIVRSGQKPWPK